MKIKKLLSIMLACLMLMSTAGMVTSAEDSAIASIGEVSYTSLADAFAAAKEGDTVQLAAGVFEPGEVALPATLTNVTVCGAPDKATVIKNSSIVAADDPAMNYTGITIDGIVFDNAYIALAGKGTGEAVFKDWTVTNCEFKNIVTPKKNRPAFEYSQKAVIEKMTNFTFKNNVIDGVSGGYNSGVRIASGAGKITISQNTIKNVAWNAIQLTNIDETSVNDLEDDPVVEITENTISDIGADEGMINVSNVKCTVTLTGNTLQKRIAEQPYLCYVKTNVETKDNKWLDENGNALEEKTALAGVFVKENPELDKAIARLETLGIAKGMSENYFGEDEMVTREQMATFIYRFINKGEFIENGENTSPFADVQAYAGMISWANAQGIIKGISENEFNPQGGITLQDCYTIALRALGYTENSELSYPAGYLALAEKLRLSENVQAAEPKEELTRGDVAIILYNALYADKKDGGNVAVSIYERHPLDGKKVLFIGNSMTFHGYAVFRKSRTVLSLESRRNDMGYFYQLAKSNGAEPAVTNWTWGGHYLKHIFSNECEAARECKGLDHLSNFTDYDYDYVILQEATTRDIKAEDAIALTEKFKAVNPDTKFFALIHSAYYYSGIDCTEYTAKLEKAGITVIDWGKLVTDIASGKTAVSGATETYNKNSFIVALSETDGHHPNLLTGYITALMTYCGLTGESAVGQAYDFCSDTEISTEFDFEKYVQDYYIYDNATTNFPEIFASESDMKGIQQLADQYLAQ